MAACALIAISHRRLFPDASFRCGMQIGGQSKGLSIQGVSSDRDSEFSGFPEKSGKSAVQGLEPVFVDPEALDLRVECGGGEAQPGSGTGWP